MSLGQTGVPANVKPHRTVFTDQAIARLEATVGKPIEDRREDWEVDEARYTIGFVKRLTRAVGDKNPLFWKEDLAATSRVGRMVVPPGVIAEWEQLDPEVEALPGCRAVLKSADLSWDRLIMEDDALLSSTEVKKVALEGDANRGRVVEYGAETRARNHRAEPVGIYLATWRCYERGTAAEAAVFGDREPAFYETDDLIAIRNEYRSSEAKLAACYLKTRHWDDVAVGEDLPYVLKGPTTIVRRAHRWAHYGISYERLKRWHRGHWEGWQQYEEHPELFIINEFGAPEPLEALDLEHDRAQSLLGVAGALESNTERLHWTIQLLTTWQGDAGFLKRLTLEFPRVNFLGDLTRCYGTVTAKKVDGAEHLVEVAVRNVNQAGAIVTTGTALIKLPARENG